MPKKKTHEEYVAELAIKQPNIQVLGHYIGTNIKIMHKCLLDGHEWEAIPNNLLRGHGCPVCNINNKTKTHDQYVADISISNPDIKIIGKYIDSNTKVLHRCEICGHEWMALPSNIHRGIGCPNCSRRIVKTHQDYVLKLKIVNPFIVVVDEFINMDTPITHKCLKDGYEWLGRPYVVLKSKSCPKCSGRAKKTNKEYIDELSIKNPYVQLIGEYIDNATNIEHKCLICGHVWFAAPHNILSGTGCPNCNKSRGEKLVSIWLDNYGVAYETQKTFIDCKDKRPLPFDFYLPDYNVAIEYNGVQHYKSIDYFGGENVFEYTVRHDNIKKEYCKQYGIKLVVIPYYENTYKILDNEVSVVMLDEVS